ncbi:MAG: ATP-dependent zinc metalloprotease FtsH [Paludibacteraceae bacterium]|nr:ATP-dependent zinc metalloprotease FtsH [Paludibacteraceae bacterium]
MDNQQNNNNRPDNQQQNNKPRFSGLSWFYIILTMVLIGAILFSGDDEGKGRNVSYSQLVTYIEQGAIDKVAITDKNGVTAHVVQQEQVVIFGSQVKDEEAYVQTDIPSIDEFVKKLDETNAVRKENKQSPIDISFKKDRDYFWLVIGNLLPFIIFILFFIWMSRGVGGGVGGGIFNVGKSQAKLYEKSDKNNRVTFKDVAGLEGAKQEVEEIVAFLKNPKKYTDLGGKIPKGALLVGPPGTGKTLLAKAVAGEADVPFFSMSGSDFVEMFVGVGASRVRDLFRQAKEKAPCIIFIDEIDAVGRARGKNSLVGGNDERESTLNQLLTEMDGFGTNSGVIILAATNRADVLDSALLRAGRFDRQIHVELPDLTERKDIFLVHLRPLKLDSTVDVNFLAKQTPGFSGADIANVCNEAALIAARKNKKAVDKQDFMDAVDRIIGGLERKNKIMTDEEKRSIAFHEAGHATISWMLRYANPLVKVTIVPRGVALGAAWYLPEERQLTNREHLLDEMCATLGGRAAEELFLNQTSTGALNDLERVTKQSYAMVAYFGMSDNLANVSYYDSSGQSQYGFTKPFSEKTAETIDADVKAIIAGQMARAKQILQDNAEGHHKIAELLIEREVITSDDVEAILGPRPWKSRQDQIIEDNEQLRAQSESEKEETEKSSEPTQTQDEINE